MTITTQAQIIALGHKFGTRKTPAAARAAVKQYVASKTPLVLPTIWDLRTDGATAKPLPATLPLDQGSLDTCVPNAYAAAAMWLLQTTYAGRIPSRLYDYYYGRLINGLENVDGGSVIGSVLESLASRGTCYESGPNDWPYVDAEVNVQPPATCDAVAKTNILSVYSAIELSSIVGVENALHNGYPVMAGIEVYPEFESLLNYTTGRVPMFTAKDVSIGGHCVLLIGYNSTTKLFTFINSWGSTYGQNGVGTIPYGYIENSTRGCFDLFAIEGVTVS